MKTIIKIVAVVAVLTAAFQVGRSFLTNYQFEDAVHQGLLFNPRGDEQQLTDMVMKAAAEYDVEVNPSDIVVTNNGPEVKIDITYTANVAVIPGVYARDVTFHPTASTRFLPGATRLR